MWGQRREWQGVAPSGRAAGERDESAVSCLYGDMGREVWGLGCGAWAGTARGGLDFRSRQVDVLQVEDEARGILRAVQPAALRL